MTKDGLFIGEVARRSGASRKALRIYEAAGILAPPQRTPSGTVCTRLIRWLCCHSFGKRGV